MKSVLTILIILSQFLVIYSQQNNSNPQITSTEIQEHINYLASDELMGRFTGSESCYKAGEYIKTEFESYGLQPAFEESYFQEFQFIESVKMGNDNKLIINSSGIETHLALTDDFIPAQFSRKVSAKGELVFAGYGISAPKLEYDDYTNINVEGKIVVVLRFNPEYDNPHSKFDSHTAYRKKASVARDKGAIGIIFVNGAFPEIENDDLMEFKYDRAPGIKGIAAVQMKRKFLEKLFDEEGLVLADFQKIISENKKPASFLFTDVKVDLATDVSENIKTARNVGAILGGNDPLLKNEYVVLGGHYDHLGMGGHGSLYRGSELKIHNGADDNASGISGVLELAEKFASSKNNKRSIFFFAFSGEELGLLGSNHLVNNFPAPVENVVSMINMDMIGRPTKETNVTIFGMGTSSKWKTLVEEKNTYKIDLSFKEDGYGPSDHSSFYGKEIPVLFFFTGTHTDYHRPSDTAEKINAEGEAILVNYIFDIAIELVNHKEKPDYVHVPRKSSGMSGGWKVYVGTIPDYGYNGEGFKFSDVSKGGPAEKSGLQGGDIMISFGGKKINNIYDYVYALKEHVPGDLVEVIVLRNNKKLKFKVELGAK